MVINLQPYDQIEGKKLVKGKLSDIDKMKIDEQKKAIRSGYDPDILPPDLVNFSDEARRLDRDMEKGNERLFDTSITVIAEGSNYRDLEDSFFAIDAIVQGHNCKLRKLTYQQEAGFAAGLPLGVSRIPITRALTTSAVAAFVPFVASELRTGGEPLYYGINAITLNLLFADRKELKNPNGLILGIPGGGKSFSVKVEMLLSILQTNDHVMICDPEGEYAPLVNACGGQMVKISATSPHHINPMDINMDYSDDDNPLALKSDFILSLIELAMNRKNGMMAIEMSICDRCMPLTYSDYFADPQPEKMPILGDLQKLIAQQPEPEAAGIATALEIYVNGSLSVFNHRTNVELSNRLVCFDIKDLGKQLKRLGMLIVLDQVWNRVTANHAAKVSTRYYVDEFHLLLRDEQTAAYMVEIWKRFRKWGGIPTGITQNVKDLLASREIENILDNSDFILMLSQASGDRSILAKHLGISDQQLSYVTNAESGCDLLFYGDVIVPFENKFEKGTKLYKLLTTKPGESEVQMNGDDKLPRGEPEVKARKNTTLADDLGTKSSGRLKGSSNRQRSTEDPMNESKPTRTYRVKKQTTRQSAEAAASNERQPSRLKASASKGRHALRFAEDVGMVASGSVANNDDVDSSEEAITETGRRISAPVLSGSRFKHKPNSRTTNSPNPASPTSRLSANPRFASKDDAVNPTKKRSSVIWRKRFWKKAAAANASAKTAAAKGTEQAALSGTAAIKARISRSFTAIASGGGAKVVIAVILCFALIASAATTTFVPLASGVFQAMGATSYVAEDADILSVDNAYIQLEASKEAQAQAAKSSHPGYDEYRYQLDEVGRDPYALASILTARYGDYTLAVVRPFLSQLVNAQYSISYSESTETIQSTDEDGYATNTEKKVLTTTLTNRGLAAAAASLLNSEELAHYEVTYATYGNRDGLFSDTYTSNNGGSGGMSYDPSAEAMSDAKFAAMWNEAKKYLGYPYVWGGSSPSTSFDCSGLVCWVINHSGVGSVGRTTADGLTGYCTRVNKADAKPGDLIFFQGTYDTAGASHVGIVVGDGKMVHCGNPIQVTSYESAYWQAHFMAIGRIRG